MLMEPLDDFRSVFSETAAATQRALAAPHAYAAYKNEFNRSLREQSPFFEKAEIEPCPLVFSERERRGLAQLGGKLFPIVEKIIQMYINGIGELLDFFPQYILLRPLMRRQLATWQQYGRYDFMIDSAGTPVFIETNAAMPGGFLPTHMIGRRFIETAPDFLAVEGMQDVVPSGDLLVGEFVRKMVRSFTSDEGAVAILIDENHKTNEVDLITPSLEAAGLRVVTGDVGDLVWSDGYRLGADGPRIIATYDKIRLFGGKHHWSAGAPARYHTFLQAVDANAFLTINNFACLTVAEDKGIFAAMRLPAVEEALSEDERAFVMRHTPESHVLSSASVTADGAPLVDDVTRNRGEWVLKPRNDYQGSGVHSGRDHDAEAWRAMVDDLLAGDVLYLAQRRVDPYIFPVAVADGDHVSPIDMHLVSGIYYHYLGMSGLVARVSPSEIANVSAGTAFLLPTAAVP